MSSRVELPVSCTDEHETKKWTVRVEVLCLSARRPREQTEVTASCKATYSLALTVHNDNNVRDSAFLYTCSEHRQEESTMSDDEFMMEVSPSR